MHILPGCVGVVLGPVHVPCPPPGEGSTHIDGQEVFDTCTKETSDLQPDSAAKACRKVKRKRGSGDNDATSRGNARHRAIICTIKPAIAVFECWWAAYSTTVPTGTAAELDAAGAAPSSPKPEHATCSCEANASRGEATRQHVVFNVASPQSPACSEAGSHGFTVEMASGDRTGWIALHALKRVLHPKIWIPRADGSEQQYKLFNALVSVSPRLCSVSPSQSFIVARAHESHVLLPCNSRFLMSHGVDSLGALIPRSVPDSPGGGSQRYRMIIIDPPWENASARRGAKYECLPSSHFLRLPIRQLLHPRGIVALWMTNRERLFRFIEEELLPAWGVELVATWYWVKVKPQDGGTTLPVDCMHRHPYEPLLLLQAACATPHSPVDGSCSDRGQAALHAKVHGHQPEGSAEGSEGGEAGKRVDPHDVTHPLSTGWRQLAGEQQTELITGVSETDPLRRDGPDGAQLKSQEQVLISGKARRLSDEAAEEVVPGDLAEQSGRSCVPDNFCIFSAPGEHSRKPHIGPLLKAFVPGLFQCDGSGCLVGTSSDPAARDAREEELCLELFAREVRPGFTAWGNEVLLFNEIYHHER